MSKEENGSAAEKLTFLLIGAGIGATLALLFAPKSGRELRTDIADLSRKGLDVAGEGARQIGERASDLYDTSRGKVSDIYGTARERVSSGADLVSDLAARQKDQLSAAIEAGKLAYKEEKRKSTAATEGQEA
ncbi:MAG: hypothetical protein DMF61_17160 [Blastocatellia bacterium AA13]|nr:MAG: hypothetical protein DMF61_17160 [Blastocatellia bacterium AA13]